MNTTNSTITVTQNHNHSANTFNDSNTVDFEQYIEQVKAMVGQVIHEEAKEDIPLSDDTPIDLSNMSDEEIEVYAETIKENPWMFLSIGKYLPKPQHRNLLESLLQDENISEVFENLAQYLDIPWLDISDQQYLHMSMVEKLLAHNKPIVNYWRKSGVDLILDNFDKFIGVESYHKMIVDQLWAGGKKYKVIHNIKKFRNIDEYYGKILAFCIEQDDTDNVAEECIYFILSQPAFIPSKEFINICLSKQLYAYLIKIADKYDEDFAQNIANCILSNKKDWHILFEHRDIFDFVDYREIAQQLINAGYYEFLIDILDKTPEIEQLHREIVMKMLHDDCRISLLPEYLEKFHNIEDLHPQIANKLIEKGYHHNFLPYLYKFVGVDEVAIALRMIEQNSTDRFLHYFNPQALQNYEGKGFNRSLFQKEDMRNIIKAIVNRGEYGLLAQNIHILPEIDPLKFARHLLGIKEFQALAYALSNFQGLGHEELMVLFCHGYGSDISHDIKSFTNLDPKVQRFFQKLKGKVSDQLIVGKLSRFSDRVKNLREMLDYMLLYKQGAIVPFIQKITDVWDMGMQTNFGALSHLTDTQWIDGKETTYIKEHLLKNFEKLLTITNDTGKEKKMRSFQQYLSSVKNFDATNIVLLQKQYEPVVIKYFERILDHKLYTTIKSHLGDIGSELISRLLQNHNFIEIFKMYLKTSINKEQFKSILQAYINNESIEDVKKLLDNPKNNEWRSKMEDQGMDMSYFLQEHRQTFQIQKDAEYSHDQDIQHFYGIAKGYMQQLGYNDEIQTVEDLVSVFQREWKPKENQELIYQKSGFTQSEFDQIFANIELQVRSIQELFHSQKAKNITSIILYRETNPMRVLMMGNWVDGSCLSFYSSVGNFWSTAINALDINKSVFYFEDQNGNIIGRVLVAIDNNGNLLRFHMYKKGNISINLDQYFDPYIRDIVQKSGMGINGDIQLVELLNGEKWYKDPVYTMKESI